MKPNRADWTLLKFGITRKNRELLMSVENYLEERSSDILRQLMHDVECCCDLKSFYEKEIPYRMQTWATMDLRHITKMMSQGFANNLYWLQTSLRQFGISRFEIPFTNYSLTADGYKQEPLDLMDTHKSRLYMRAGTLITAVCLSGFGIGVFIGSLLVGTGAEEYFFLNTQKSKQKVSALLPDIVYNYKSQMKMHILEAMARPNSEIINTLNNIQNGQLKLQ